MTPKALIGRAIEDLLPAPDGSVWSEKGPLDAHEASLLRALTGLAPLGRQAEGLARRLGLDTDALAMLEDDLVALQARGFLLQTNDLRRQGPTDTPATRISTCAILSCGRPGLLQRAIRDLGRPAAQAGRRLLISDDARQASAPAATDVAMEWLHRGHRQRWIEQLPDDGLRRSASFALLPDDGGDTTVGANCNAVFLAAREEALALLDDDTSGPVGRALPSEPRRRVVGPDGDPTLLLLYDARDEAIGDVLAIDSDPASLLEVGLGQRVAQLGQESPLEFEEQTPAHAVRAIVRGGRVLTSMMGVAGDSGMSSPLSFLGLTEDAGQRLDQDFSRRLFSRNLIRAAPDQRLSQSGFFMNACCAMDLRQGGLLPFYPVGRDSDGLFGTALNQLEPDAFRLYLPWLVCHQPPPRPPYRLADLQAPGAAAPPIALIRHALSQWRPPRRMLRRADRRQALGLYLEGLGRLPLKQLTAYMADARLSDMAAQMRWLGLLLERAPAVRQGLIEQCLVQTRARLQALSTAPEQSICRQGYALQDYADALSQYGQLLQCWDELQRAAAANPLRGEQVAP